jgi:predicted MPP superfamily phosphohydrolase
MNSVARKFEWNATGTLCVRRIPVGRESNFNALYLSDLHLHPWREHLISQILTKVNAIKPQVILLGGDLVDTSRSLASLSFLIKEMVSVAPVFAVLGNHDYMVGASQISATILDSGGVLLTDKPVHLHSSERKINFYGSITDSFRREPGSLSVCCAHDPAIFPTAVKVGVDLVLAGHLHGSQFVLAEREGMLYPGALFFRWNGLKFSSGSTTMFVSRGIADTLPLRWNCPREALLCQL